jgi:hypothetical protein
MEAFSINNVKSHLKDITMKIEPIIGQEIDVKNDFGANEGEKVDEKDSDGSGDLNAAGMLSSKFLLYDQEIDSIYTTSNMSDLSYICITSRLRYSIYYIQDDNMGSADFTLIWNNDYRFDKHLKSMGQILTMDFHKSCKTFITGSQLGWICIWSLCDRVLMHRIRVKAPGSDQIQMCNIVKMFSD